MVELYSDWHAGLCAPADLGCRPIELALENEGDPMDSRREQLEDLATFEVCMRSINPYTSPVDAAGQPERGGLLATSMALVIVVAVAVVAGAIAPTIAHLAGAPSEFTIGLLRLSMITCIPFGIAVGVVTSRCVRYRTRVSSIGWFFTIFVVVLPLALYPRTAGPLVDYTALALGVTIVAALIVARIFRHSADDADLRR